MIVREAFKQGTEPTAPCRTHTTPTASPVVPMFDEFGNPIVTNTAGLPPTDTGGFEVPPDSTLTGGVFRDPTTTGGAPPPVTVPPPTRLPPPTTTTEEPEEEPEEPEEEPPPPTDTTTTTSGPPEMIVSAAAFGG
jgi:hypothetical protein